MKHQSRAMVFMFSRARPAPRRQISFLPKSGRRIHRACAESRKKTSKAPGDGENKRCSQQGERITRIQSEELTADQVRQRQRQRNTKSEAGGNHDTGFS